MPAFTFQLRRGTSAQWALRNPILFPGEPGIDQDLNNFKIGDGTTRWNQLPYFIPETTPSGSGDAAEVLTALNMHINSLTPHQAYEEGPSLALLYQNAKV